MRKIIVIMLVVIAIVWLAISRYWTGSKKISNTENQYPAITPTEVQPTISPTPEATGSSQFVATSSSVKLVAPTITVDIRY